MLYKVSQRPLTITSYILNIDSQVTFAPPSIYTICNSLQNSVRSN